jgi:hypothetical protein
MKERPYAVVCTDLHKAVGPLRYEDALRLAEKMTDGADTCVYLPVAMELVQYEEERVEEDGSWPGVYL